MSEIDSKGKKRKSTWSNGAEQLPNKTPRQEKPPQDSLESTKLTRQEAAVQQWGLEKIYELPQELWLEIYGLLKPLDLIHLSRANKTLRSFFMSRTTHSVWKSALSNIPFLPECPSDMDEPAYASLIFVKKCHFCPRDQGIIHIVWAARIRACTKCIEKRWRTQKIAALPGVSDVYKFVPYVDFRSKELDWRYYDFDTEYRWREEFRNSEDGYKWAADKVAEQSVIDEHAQACMDWEQASALLEPRYVEPGNTIEDRKGAIFDRVLADGWLNELTFMSEEKIWPKLMNHKEVVKVCKGVLTEKVFLDLDPCLDQIMTEVFELKLAKGRHALLKKCIPIIQDILSAYIDSLPANSVCVGIGDVILHPLAQNYINSPNPESVEHLRTMMPNIAADIKLALDNKICDLIRSSTPGHAFNCDVALNLATTLFSCTRCRGATSIHHGPDPIRYPRVINHYCAVYADSDKVGNSKEIDIDICGQITRKTSWNRFKPIKMDKDDYKLLSDIVSMSGLDPKTATATEMDALDPVFECLPCNNRYEGRATMRWSLPGHRRDWTCKGRRQVPPTFVLLKGQEAEAVRRRMDEEEARRNANNMYLDLICAHCKIRAGSATLLDHCKKTHGILNPTDEDVLPYLDGRCNQSVFRLWPPREDEPEVDSNSVAQ